MADEIRTILLKMAWPQHDPRLPESIAAAVGIDRTGDEVLLSPLALVVTKPAMVATLLLSLIAGLATGPALHGVHDILSGAMVPGMGPRLAWGFY